MKLTHLSFFLTDKCTAACKICCYKCNPNGNQVLNKELIKDYIRQLTQINSKADISFTGGEALVCYDILRECMEYANKLNFKSSLVTNCSFGKSVDEAKNLLKDLMSVGLYRIGISTDRFHQQFVPIQYVKNVLIAANEINLSTQLRLMETKNDESTDNTLDALRPEIYTTRTVFYPALPIGCATDNIPTDQFVKLFPADSARCIFDRSVIVLFNGDLLMCCSQFSHEIPLLKIGTFGKTSLEEAVKNISSNNYIYVMLKNGFGWYTNLAKHLGFKVDDFYGYPCQLCYELFSNKDFVAQVASHVKKEADKLRLQKFFSA